MQRVCCICGEEVRRDDTTGVEIALNSLWHKHNPTTQAMQAHSRCIAGTLHADVPFDQEMWGEKQ